MTPELKTGVPTEVLATLSGTLLSVKTIEELIYPLLEMLELVTELESTYLTRIDLAAGVQNIIFARNSKVMQIPEGLAVPWENTLCKRALEDGCQYTDDVPTMWGDSDAARALGIQTYASSPVYMEDGAIYGTLCGASMDSKPLSDKGKHLLTLFSTLISRQIERERLVSRLQDANVALEAASTTDALTGLPNRRRILTEMTRLFALARRTDQRVLVAFIDLDGFKRINDTYGHEVGDDFLVEVGRRLSAGLRSGDMLGRLGGDEFVILGLTAQAAQDDPPPAEAMQRRLAPLLQGHYDLGACAFDYPGASFGVVDVLPAATSPEEALRDADALMYANKKARLQAPAQARKH